MKDAVVDRLVSQATSRAPAERARLARAIRALDQLYELGRKIASEPELVSILEEFTGRLERAFGRRPRRRLRDKAIDNRVLHESQLPGCSSAETISGQ